MSRLADIWRLARIYRAYRQARQTRATSLWAARAYVRHERQHR